jgi:hypothetical protein
MSIGPSVLVNTSGNNLDYSCQINNYQDAFAGGAVTETAKSLSYDLYKEPMWM